MILLANKRMVRRSQNKTTFTWAPINRLIPNWLCIRPPPGKGARAMASQKNVPLRSFHVFTRACVHLDFFASLDEQRSLNRDPGFERDCFLHVVGRIATNSFWSIRYGQHYARG